MLLRTVATVSALSVVSSSSWYRSFQRIALLSSGTSVTPSNSVARASESRSSASFSRRYCAGDLFGLCEDDFGELARDGCGLIDAIQMDTSGDRLDPVDDVVQGGGQ